MTEEKKESVPSEAYALCEKAWTATLKHYGIERPIFSFEKMKISRLIKSYDYKSVCYALTGMRFEQKTDQFDPSKHLALARLDNPQLFEKFLNMSCIEMGKQKKNAQK